jgi:hypothetical protein
MCVSLRQVFVDRQGKGGTPRGYRPVTPSASYVDVARPHRPRSSAVAAVLGLADSVGPLLQYNNTGFMRNRRQHRQFGLAGLEMAQVCVRVV